MHDQILTRNHHWLTLEPTWLLQESMEKTSLNYNGEFFPINRRGILKMTQGPIYRCKCAKCNFNSMQHSSHNPSVIGTQGCDAPDATASDAPKRSSERKRAEKCCGQDFVIFDALNQNVICKWFLRPKYNASRWQQRQQAQLHTISKLGQTCSLNKSLLKPLLKRD